MAEFDNIKNEFIQYAGKTFSSEESYINGLKYILKEIQTIEDDFGIKIYDADLEILSCFWNMLVQGKLEKRIKTMGFVVNHYIAWAIENGKSVKQYNQFPLVQIDPTSTIKALFLKDIDDLTNYISIGNPKQADDIITIAHYDSLIMQLVYCGFTCQEAITLPYKSLDVDSKTITAFDKKVVLTDRLFEKIMEFVKSPYINVVQENKTLRKPKNDIPGLPTRLLSTNARTINHRKLLGRLKGYNDKYCERTGLFRRIWLRNVYLSGVFYRKHHGDDSVKLEFYQEQDYKNFVSVYYQ